MPTKLTFPSTPEEAATWHPFVTFRALSSKVLAVANSRIEGAWAAYVDAVPGYDHRQEIAEVLARGAKLEESIARALFPGFEGVRYAP